MSSLNLHVNFGLWVIVLIISVGQMHLTNRVVLRVHLRGTVPTVLRGFPLAYKKDFEKICTIFIKQHIPELKGHPLLSLCNLYR